MSEAHFNSGNVWGRVISAKVEKSEGHKEYLAIQISCSGPRGNVQAYGRLWGRDRFDPMLEAFKANPAGQFRFRGFISQYEKDGEILSNYTFFQWEPTEGQEPRAAFILKGEVLEVDPLDGWVRLQVVRKGSNGYRDTEEEFRIWLGRGVLADAEPGNLVQVKGYLQQGDGEDEFGDASGPVRPVALQGDISTPF